MSNLLEGKLPVKWVIGVVVGIIATYIIAPTLTKVEAQGEAIGENKAAVAVEKTRNDSQAQKIDKIETYIMQQNTISRQLTELLKRQEQREIDRINRGVNGSDGR